MVTCPVCGEELEDRAAIDAHEHEVPLAWHEAGAGFECPTDGLLFDTEEELIEHQAREHR